jgi:hypothetical protein
VFTRLLPIQLVYIIGSSVIVKIDLSCIPVNKTATLLVQPGGEEVVLEVKSISRLTVEKKVLRFLFSKEKEAIKIDFLLSSTGKINVVIATEENVSTLSVIYWLCNIFSLIQKENCLI